MQVYFLELHCVNWSIGERHSSSNQEVTLSDNARDLCYNYLPSSSSERFLHHSFFTSVMNMVIDQSSVCASVSQLQVQ